jgi:hypothetical protein
MRERRIPFPVLTFPRSRVGLPKMVPRCGGGPGWGGRMSIEPHHPHPDLPPSRGKESISAAPVLTYVDTYGRETGHNRTAGGWCGRARVFFAKDRCCVPCHGSRRSGPISTTRSAPGYLRSLMRMFLNSAHIGLPACNCRARIPSRRASAGSLSEKSRISRLLR